MEFYRKMVDERLQGLETLVGERRRFKTEASPK
jgi:hypothetical protein